MAGMSARMNSIVLTGASGLLGAEFRDSLSLDAEQCLTRDDLDIKSYERLRQTLSHRRPSMLINCAADTDVEGAEANPERAYSVNAILPGLLARSCYDLDIPFIHFSSTGCYGDSRMTPHNDFDRVRPKTVHHRAKIAGEKEVRTVGGRHLILRLGWLYGGNAGHRKNFVWNRICEARGQSEIVSDPHQIGVPTWTGDVVKQTINLLEADIYGTFNCVATGATSRYDYVQTIISAAKLDTRLRPRRFSRIAPVSSNESAVNLKLDMLGLNIMPAWDKALIRYVADLL